MFRLFNHIHDINETIIPSKYFQTIATYIGYPLAFMIPVQYILTACLLMSQFQSPDHLQSRVHGIH